MWNISNINKRIKNIKAYGLTPITLKAPANIIEKIVSPKGTSNEGLIMSYKEASFIAFNARNERLTLDEYNRSLNIFMNQYENQTYTAGAINAAYREGIKKLEWIFDKFPEFSEKVNELSEKDVVEMLNYVGNNIAEYITVRGGKNEYPSDAAFVELCEQWIEDNKQ